MKEGVVPLSAVVFYFSASSVVFLCHVKSSFQRTQYLLMFIQSQEFSASVNLFIAAPAIALLWKDFWAHDWLDGKADCCYSIRIVWEVSVCQPGWTEVGSDTAYGVLYLSLWGEVVAKALSPPSLQQLSAVPTPSVQPLSAPSPSTFRSLSPSYLRLLSAPATPSLCPLTILSLCCIRRVSAPSPPYPPSSLPLYETRCYELGYLIFSLTLNL